MSDDGEPVRYRVGDRWVNSTRGTHTPEQRATALIWQLADQHVRVFPEEWDKDYGRWIFSPLWHERPERVSGDDLRFNVLMGDSEDAKAFRQLYDDEQRIVILATAYAVEAIKEARAGNVALAWDCAVDAAELVGFLEGREPLEGAPSTAPPVADAAPGNARTPRTVWRRLIQESIEAIDKAHGGSARAEQAMRWLANHYEEEIRFDPPDTLNYRLQNGAWKEVAKKAVQNELATARAIASPLGQRRR